MNVRIVMRNGGNNDISLLLTDVTVARRYLPYIVLGTPDLRKRPPKHKNNGIVCYFATS